MGKVISLRSEDLLPPGLMVWKIIQVIFWFVGLGLFLIMLIKPDLGVVLFWNILIPIAPALLVIGTGVWRNICPLATTALLPDRFGLSKRKKLSSSQRATLSLAGIILLLAIIPLRHILFNNSGQATATIIMAVGILALISGFVFERKSGWCSGLCPVHPVEKLYGGGVAFSVVNAHCNECVKCSVPCPDSTPNFSPVVSSKLKSSKWIENLIVGGFPGYIWGWFQVPDYAASFGWTEVLITYSYPLGAGAITLLMYRLIRDAFPQKNRYHVVNFFAATAVSCYYWFRLPMLLGFGVGETNGMLIDLTLSLPAWSMTLLNLGTTAFFFWWMLIRKKKKASWALRPVYANG